jgi:sugar phosphate isomerase/epimerase
MDTQFSRDPVSRREFLRRTSILTGAVALAACTPWKAQGTSVPAVENVMKNRFLLGVSTSIFPGKSISEQEYALLGQYSIASVEIGYEQAGPALSDASLRKNLVALVQDAQPPVFSLHAPYQPYRDLSFLDEKRRLAAVGYAEEALELASKLGAKVVTIHGSQDPIAEGTRADRRAQARRSLADLVPKARALNLRLALETMPPEWLPAGVDEAFDMVQDLDPEVVGFCLDTNHANLTGDLSGIVHALGPRLWNVHLSDNDGHKQQHWMPFKGVIDWKAFLAALDEVDYRGPLHYELDPHPDGPEQSLQDIKRNFEQLLALAPS